MKILVCISQVPDTTTKITFSADGKELATTGITYIINPYDELALTKALELKEAAGKGTVTVINVGDAGTEPTIRKCLAIGADDAVRIDTTPVDGLHVASAIAAYAKGENFDIIFTGRESIDYNSGVVGPMLAELTDSALVNIITRVEADGSGLVCDRDIDGGRETVKVAMPVVFTAQKDLTEPRIPNMRGIMAARSKPLKVVSAESAEQRTGVNQFIAPKQKAPCHFIDASNVDELVNLLRTEAKVI